jgi:hypothetical protein
MKYVLVVTADRYGKRVPITDVRKVHIPAKGVKLSPPKGLSLAPAQLGPAQPGDHARPQLRVAEGLAFVGSSRRPVRADRDRRRGMSARQRSDCP